MADASATSKSGNVIQVTFTGAGGDWVWSTNGGYTGDGIKVRAIEWLPSAANDILVVNEGGADGPSIVHWKAGGISDSKQITYGSGVWMKPYIDFTDCTFTTTTTTKVMFIIA